jgi:hypothetical protein
VHFGARPVGAPPVLVHYAGGLWGDGHDVVLQALGGTVPIGMDDAVRAYAGNSRQVGNGLLVPDGVSESFLESMRRLGLRTHAVPLFELFGKAGGGPACATLYLPKSLRVAPDAPIRYSVSRDAALGSPRRDP